MPTIEKGTLNLWVYLKISPMKRVMRFGKKGKLSPCYLRSFEICKRVGSVAHELNFISELDMIHLMFHFSILKKCIGNQVSILPL